MSGLRYFDDLMADAIERERIQRRAQAYDAACQSILETCARHGMIPSESFHKANEGKCATRIITKGTLQ